MRVYYTLTTLDPIIVSQTSATTNNHECLDYIPGSAILGALAASHYPLLNDEDSWQAFHSGAVRFSPCYPVVDRQLCLPVPAGWHVEKGKSPFDENSRLQHSNISNHSAPSFKRENTVQYKQCRTGYLNAQGKSADVKLSLTAKTALDGATGRAAESQLFSYAHIDAGQEFAGWFETDNEDLKKRFTDSLQGELRVGRSRNTEFGRVSCRIVEAKMSEPEASQDQLVLWCLSDCEVINDFGLPTLSPQAKELHRGLTGLTLVPEKSFIRATRVSRFNQKRQGLDSEQVLISKGSVLVYKGIADANVVKEIARNGIGINQQQGLGWVSVNPAWANESDFSEQILFAEVKFTDLTKQIPNVSFNSLPLTRLQLWAQERMDSRDNNQVRQQWVNQLIQRIVNAYHNARQYNHIHRQHVAGPSSTQLRRVAGVFRNSSPDWKSTLFEGQHAICQANNDELGWGISWHNGEDLMTFAKAFSDILFKTPLDETQSPDDFIKPDVATMRLLLEQLCKYDLSTFRGLAKIDMEIQQVSQSRSVSSNQAEVY